jgi:hypothetical protein
MLLKLYQAVFMFYGKHTISLYVVSAKCLGAEEYNAKGAAIKFYQHNHPPPVTFIIHIIERMIFRAWSA